MRILFVEDHHVFASTVVREFLSQHEVHVAPSLATAHEALQSADFDVVLVDFDLEDGKGDTLVRSLRADQPGLPIVGVSAHEQGNEALLRAGANAICEKLRFPRIGAVLEEARGLAGSAA